MITKGNWQVGRHGSQRFEILSDRRIAVVDMQDDANLIAAAPDMYEALKFLVEKYWKNKGSDGKTCPHPGEFISCITPEGIPNYWKQADKALAKAEGREDDN